MKCKICDEYVFKGYFNGRLLLMDTNNKPHTCNISNIPYKKLKGGAK